MTSVEFVNEGGRISGFCCKGHSGYGEAGTDIVCAAVTTAVRVAEATIRDVLGVSCKVQIDEASAMIKLALPASCEDAEETVQAVLSGMMLTLCDLRDEYPDYIEVLEV